MKRLLIVTAAFSALATAAPAQPAYDGSQGPPPQDYPVCSYRGQDRCIQRSAARRIDRERRQEQQRPTGRRGSSTDGERG